MLDHHVPVGGLQNDRPRLTEDFDGPPLDLKGRHNAPWPSVMANREAELAMVPERRRYPLAEVVCIMRLTHDVDVAAINTQADAKRSDDTGVEHLQRRQQAVVADDLQNALVMWHRRIEVPSGRQPRGARSVSHGRRVPAYARAIKAAMFGVARGIGF